jgi:cytochrome c-type biogenesis protein CcmH/NrfG
LAFQAGDYQNALNAYSAAYKMKPLSPQARGKIALALTMLGRVEEAQKYQ